jgi:heptosyltransferase-2
MTLKPSRILVVAPNWIGDVVMATPAFRSLREGFADARISVAVRRNARAVLDDAPWFDEVIEVNPAEQGFFGTLRLSARLRRKAFDLGVLLTNSFRTALAARLSRVRHILGYSREFRGVLLSESLKPRRRDGKFVPAPMVDYYLELCRRLGCSVSNHRLELFYREEVSRGLDEFSRRHGIDWTRRIVVMNPGASFGSSKCWPPEHFARTAEALSREKDVQVVVICAPLECSLAQAVADQAKCPVVSLHGEPAGLDLLKPLIHRASLLITNDTGPRHYAAAFDTPVVTVFGATDPRWSDTGFEKETIVRVEVACAPCQLRTCPVDHRCMRWVKPEMVVEAARTLMSRFPKRK